MSYIDHACTRCGHKRIDHVELHSQICSYHWCPQRCTEDLMELGPSKLFATFTELGQEILRIDPPGAPVLYGDFGRTYACDCFECKTLYMMVAA